MIDLYIILIIATIIIVFNILFINIIIEIIEDIKKYSHLYNKRWKLKKLLEILFVVWLSILSIFGFVIILSLVIGG